MDCLEFRRRLATDPNARDPEFVAHRDECHAGCAESWWRAQRAEQRLKRVLQSVEAPPDLAERVLLAQATTLRTHGRRRWQAGLAVAASLLVALILAGYAWNLRLTRNGGEVAAAAVAHMDDGEAFALALTKPIGGSQLQPVFAKRGLTLRGTPARAVYAHDCDVGPYKAVHLVLRENGAPVTALYLVDHRIATARDFVRAGWHGREMPMGDGTLVLLGSGTGGFAAAEHAVANAVLGPVEQTVAEL